jgi:hypothetical protein
MISIPEVIKTTTSRWKQHVNYTAEVNSRPRVPVQDRIETQLFGQTRKSNWEIIHLICTALYLY